MGADRRIVLMGTCQDAGVAAEHPLAHFRRQFRRDVALVFDGQVADTPLRVELAVGLKCSGGAGPYTAAASSALRRPPAGSVRFQRSGSNQFAEKDLWPERWMDQHVVGPDGAKARPDCQSSLGQGDGIHTDLESICPTGPLAYEIRQLKEQRLHEIVIVFIPCVLGHRRCLLRILLGCG